MRRVYNHILLIASFIVFYSCAEEDFFKVPQQQGEKMAFSVEVNEPQQVNTRAGHDPIKTFEMEGLSHPLYVRAVTSAGIEHFQHDTVDVTRAKSMSTVSFYPSYGLIMFEYPVTDTWASVGSTSTPWIYNEEIKKAKGWMTNEFWPGVDKKVTIYGYAPYDDPNITAMSTASDAGVPWLSYEVAEDAHDENDLLISYSASDTYSSHDVPGNYDQLVSTQYPIDFHHVCTGIRFAVGAKMAPCTIKRIELRNIYGKGDYTFGDANWTLSGNPDYTFFLEEDLEIKTGDAYKILTKGNNLFMMLPQTLQSDAELYILINDGEDHELTAKIDGQVWDMGTTVTYYLSTQSVDGRYILNVTQPADVLAEGGDITYDVSSYFLSYYGSAIPIPWRAKYELDGVEYLGSDEVLTFTNMSDGETTATTYTATVGQQTPRSMTSNTHTATLRSRPVVGSASNYIDLSNGGETANCYIVTAPGYYKIPLVYGNARNNTNVYNINNFVDHTNTKITVENIYDKYNPLSGAIIWQDAPHLITPSSLKVSSDGEYLQFEIKKEDICQGNSVIAVQDVSIDVLWSWHIWVTDYDFSTSKAIPVKNHDEDMSYLMPRPLGFCDKDYRESPNRTIKLIFEQQDPDGLIASVSFRQDSIILDMGENALQYQWGRKDPFVGTYAASDLSDPRKKALDKPRYDVSSRGGNKTYYQFAFSKTKPNMGTAIQRPNIFYNSNNLNWNNVNAPNYWNISSQANATWRAVNNYPVVKTMYDPCPVGWCMPKRGAFTGFTTTGNKVSNTDGSYTNTNIEGIYGNIMRFYTGVGTNTYDVYLISASRGIDYTSDANYYGVSCWFYTSGIVNNKSGDVLGGAMGIGGPGNNASYPNGLEVNTVPGDLRYWGDMVIPDVDDGE